MTLSHIFESLLESSEEKDAKRQKLNVAEDVAPGDGGSSHLKALEPIDPPEGQPDTVKEIHALLFNEQLPEEFESRCRLTRCELCSVDLSTANGNINWLSFPIVAVKETI